MKNEAAIPNPALERFGFLLGTWSTTGTHPYVAGVTFHGEAKFEWLEGGAFLMMQTRIEEPDSPSGISVFGSDDATDRYYMLYVDERGVSRKYDVSMSENRVTWSRDSEEFSQRFALSVVDGG